jgi:hypothetical protein
MGQVQAQTIHANPNTECKKTGGFPMKPTRRAFNF